MTLYTHTLDIDRDNFLSANLMIKRRHAAFVEGVGGLVVVRFVSSPESDPNARTCEWDSSAENSFMCTNDVSYHTSRLEYATHRVANQLRFFVAKLKKVNYSLDYRYPYRRRNSGSDGSFVLHAMSSDVQYYRDILTSIKTIYVIHVQYRSRER